MIAHPHVVLAAPILLIVWSGCVQSAPSTPDRVPSADADAGGRSNEASSSIGTEDDPLVDAAGDVSYAATYFGARDHDYVDITHGRWLRADGDVVTVVLDVVDASALASGPADWSLLITANANVTIDGGVVGVLRLELGHQPTDDSFGYHIAYFRDNGAASQGRPIPHQVALEARSPGKVIVRFQRSDLLQYGDSLDDLGATFTEFYRPAGIPSQQQNGDTAASRSAYSIATRS